MTETYASEWHEPVMVEEVLDYLAVAPGGRYVDGTLGGGGHTHAILDASAPDGQVLSIDRDPRAIEFARRRLAAYGDRVQFVRGNYGDVASLAADFAPVDGLLVDAGVSSRQLDDAARGFTFRDAGPLDMRMSAEGQTLAEYLDAIDEGELARVLREWGEVKRPGSVAKAILRAWREGRVSNTAELATVIERAVGRSAGAARKTNIHPATLVFQALRIAVNRELDALEQVVNDIPKVVKSGGRAVFISFHSLEDRIVKRGFRELSTDTLPAGLPVTAAQTTVRAKTLTSKPISPTPEEVERNPRSRSARLRALEVL